MSPLSAVNKITNRLSGVNKPESFDTITQYEPYSIFPNKQIQEWANRGIYKADAEYKYAVLGKRSNTSLKRKAKSNRKKYSVRMKEGSCH